MKTLVIVAHPDIASSRVNKQWINALRDYPEEFTIHDLYEQYPSWQIDTVAEQHLVEGYEQIILQFPFYWFSCPPMLRKWFDDIFNRGWAYGTGGDKLQHKKLMLAISCGIPEHELATDGKHKYTLHELVRPFELTALYCGMQFEPLFAVYGMGHKVSDEAIQQSAQAYLQHIRTVFA
ncbi:NAD(P)H-dependent oxidoreductase [Deminuibacter soli]|uniref:Flavodoxin family protein n=1 Tax=Deminuibacter soli TaxID=2291815 RepID=A0A3E1NRC0_9BACT|nr:NAD(P)H-dependent oxidoreductase [Deminuibacter soli]RFM30364.1 flavodoxin family protein [Deminuibacter soli]